MGESDVVVEQHPVSIVQERQPDVYVRRRGRVVFVRG
jgi:hypothetical protein